MQARCIWRCPRIGLRRMTTGVDALQLEPREDRLIRALDDFSRHLCRTEPDLPPVELRIAGGWVRDKLLRMSSHDLDVATSAMSGYEFATRFVPWIDAQRARTGPTESADRRKPTTVACIAANPDQSKHLETATARVYDFDLDFVQLRSESYANESRIPSVVIGTPEEDALRRDLTINALFYNVHTRLVEDWTGKGLGDLLERRLIRTPLPALQTFLDDPLRILRCVRFAARLGFELDPDIVETAHNSAVRDALAAKVSRERVGIEVDKMLRSKPLAAFRLIRQLDLHALIFGLPPNALDVEPAAPAADSWTSLPIRAAELLHALADPATDLPASLREHLIDPLSPSDWRRLYLAAALAPLRGVTCAEKKKRVWAGERVISESVKLPAADRTVCSRLFSATDRIHASALSAALASGSRSQLGLLLRAPDIHDHVNAVSWRATLVFCIVTDASKPDADLAALLDLYARLVDRLRQLDLIVSPSARPDASTIGTADPEAVPRSAFQRPLLKGDDVAAVLEYKPGPALAACIEALVAWQLDHPDGTEDDARAFLRDERSAGRLPPAIEPKTAHPRGKKRKP